MLATVRSLYKPKEMTAGEILSETLETLVKEGLIELVRLGRGRTYVLTELGRQESRKVAA